MVDKNQLANFHWHCWEERLKIRKPTKLKVTKLEVSEDIVPQSWETFLRSYIFVSFQQITFKLGIFFLILRQVSATYWSQAKVEKPWKV